MGHAVALSTCSDAESERLFVYIKLIKALLVTIAASAASAQVASSPDSDPKTPFYDPLSAQVVPPTDSLTNTFLPGPPIDEQAPLGLAPVIAEETALGMELWRPDTVSAGENEDWSFLETDSVQVQREVLFHQLDELRAETRGSSLGSPVYFGIGDGVKLVQHQENQPGLVVPLGMSYPMQRKRWMLFTELAPILDADPSTALGWGGGVGIRFDFGR
jgi:hypothetical protein